MAAGIEACKERLRHHGSSEAKPLLVCVLVLLLPVQWHGCTFDRGLLTCRFLPATCVQLLPCMAARGLDRDTCYTTGLNGQVTGQPGLKDTAEYPQAFCEMVWCLTCSLLLVLLGLGLIRSCDWPGQ